MRFKLTGPKLRRQTSIAAGGLRTQSRSGLIRMNVNQKMREYLMNAFDVLALALDVTIRPVGRWR